MQNNNLTKTNVCLTVGRYIIYVQASKDIVSSNYLNQQPAPRVKFSPQCNTKIFARFDE